MILVFGKTGQVATELQNFGEVVALGRDQADLLDPKACINSIRAHLPEAVINAAAYTAVDKAESEEDLASFINGDAPGVIAKVCAELNIPMVHISTDYVFDGSGVAPWRTSDTPNPKNAYGRSKLKGEEAIRASGCTYAILRTSWVVSAHGSNFVKTMLQLSQTSDSLSIVDDQVGGPTCARDIAHTCVLIAKQLIHNPKKTGCYHFSGLPYVSWCQFASAIFKNAGRSAIARPIPTSGYPTPASRPSNSRLDCTMTQNVFGISAPHWKDGLKSILEELEIKHDKA